LGLTRNHEPTWLSRLPWLRIGIERRQTELRLEGSAIHTRDRSLTRLPGRWTEEVLGRCLCRPRLTRCGPLRLTRLLRNWSTTSRRRSHRTTRLTRLVHGSTRLPRSWPLGLTRLRLTRLRLTRLRLTRLVHGTTRLTRLVHGSTRLPRSWPLGLTRLRLTRLVHGSTRLPRSWPLGLTRLRLTRLRLTRLVHGSTRLPRSWPLGLTRLRLTRLRLTRLRLTRLLRTRLLRNRSATRWRRTLLTARRWLLLGQGHRGHGENACRGQRSQRR
jgi:hypothetical protein